MAVAQESGSFSGVSNLVASPTGDRCANCGTSLAPDQRYCVECGERRGRSRFSAVPGAAAAEAATASGVALVEGRGRPPRVRWGSSSTFVAGVGTLLLAMGVGVLIGENGQSTAAPQRAAAAPQVITVNAGGGVAAPATGLGSNSTAPSMASNAKVNSKKAAAAPVSQAVAQKATQAATKIVGSKAKIAAPTVTVGAKCSGAGCTNGHFTGNFFGN